MGLRLITAPTRYPVTLEETKAHLCVETDRASMVDLVKPAKKRPETLTERSVAATTHRGDCRRFGWEIDVTNHTDPNVWLEVEAFISIDGGKTWMSDGMVGRWGGVTIHPETGGPDPKMTSLSIYHAPISNPTVKCVVRRSDAVPAADPIVSVAP